MTANIVKKKIMLELPCPITEREELDISRHKARAELELEELLAEFADVKRDWGKRVEEKEKYINQLGAVIRTGEQKRVIECFERYVGDGEHAGKVEVVRKDTDEVIERRMANLLEARGANPDPDETPEQRDAARTQAAAGVEEDEDGDVIPPAGDGKKSRKRKPH